MIIIQRKMQRRWHLANRRLGSTVEAADDAVPSDLSSNSVLQWGQSRIECATSTFRAAQ